MIRARLWGQGSGRVSARALSVTGASAGRVVVVVKVVVGLNRHGVVWQACVHLLKAETKIKDTEFGKHNFVIQVMEKSQQAY